MKYEATTLLTKKALSASLKKLLEKKQFSKITVSDIIAGCGFNRKTFYYHFADTKDLLKWTFDQEATEIVKGFEASEKYGDAVLFILKYINENKHMISCVYDSIGRDELKTMFHDDFAELLRSMIGKAEKEQGRELPPEYRNFIVSFYTEATTGILVEWLKSSRPYDEKTAAEYISSVVKYTVPAVIEQMGK